MSDVIGYIERYKKNHLEIDTAKVDNYTLVSGQMPDVGHIRIEHQHVQVHADTNGSWREVVITTSGGVSELMKERRKQNRNIYYDYCHEVYIIKRQVFFSRGEQENHEQNEINRQYEVI